MIDYQLLKKLVFEVLKEGIELNDKKIILGVEKLVNQYNAFPTKEDCAQCRIDYRYYQEKRLNPLDELSVNQIIWDLIIDRVLTIGMDASNQEWPWLRLTEFGRSVVEQTTVTYYDPEGYGTTLDSVAPEIDPIIKQYAVEGLNCFRQRLFFASAVMFGAAAEKAILLLLESIGNAETNKRRQQEIMQLLDRPNLPKIFSNIQSRLDLLIKAKAIPYSVHQGSNEHLLSLFEMIRIQRNDAVHPTAGQVNKTKVFLTIQSLPVALEVVFRLIDWFKKNMLD
jgi:hypothetical protein